MQLFYFILGTLLFFVQPLSAGTFCESFRAQKCLPKDARQEVAYSHCEIEKKAAHCEDYYRENPEAASKARDCEKIVLCPNYGKLRDYSRACVAGFKSNLEDFSEGIYDFITEDSQMPPEMAEREDFFKNCTTAECKRQMLGPYVHFFSKEQIEGHPSDKNLDPRDPAHAAYLQGLSAKSLYRELLVKLKKKFAEGTLEEPLVEPWSGREANLEKSRSLNEMIAGVLEQAGVKNTACYAPEVLAELRCYAFLTLADPFVMAQGVVLIGKVAGLSGKLVKNTPAAVRAAANLRKAAVTDKMSELGATLKTWGSSSVYHRYQNLREYPELVKKIDTANKTVLQTSFAKPIADVKAMESLNWSEYTGGFVKKDVVEQLGPRFKNLDPEIKSGLHGVINKMNDKHSYMSYMEKLSSDIVNEVKKVGNPQELAALKNGTLSEAATLRVLAQRAGVRGQTHLSDNASGLRRSRSEVERGPLVNKAFSKDKFTMSHLLQEDYVADVVDAATQGKAQKFWIFLDTKEGEAYWTPLFASNKKNSLTRPEFTSQLSRRYLK